jgi:chemotaxis protein CheY-P-specific phosphatase CheC
MQQTTYKSGMYKAAAQAAKKATQALQKLISSETQLIVADLESMEKPESADAQRLAETCIELYKQNKIIVSTKIKIYKDDGSKNDCGEMLMFIERDDMNKLGSLILAKLASDKERFSAGIKESAITEALNVIGNAYIEVIAKYYKSTLMSMVPKIITDMDFDDFVGNMASESKDKVYVIFNTHLIITKNVIKIPFILAASFKIHK